MALPGDLPLDRWLPHRPPWLRIDRVSAIHEDRVVAEKRISAGDPLVLASSPPQVDRGSGSGSGLADSPLGEGGGLGGFLLIDLAAQAAACLMAAQRPGQGAHLGYLVAAQGWKFHRTALPGETLTVEVTRQAALGALVRFAGALRAGDLPVAEGEFTCAIAPGTPPGGTPDQSSPGRL
jgi:3-hydroxymyristoyl/3-hydroxydecanoyl-(acyl carrier protein) dehydratase